MRSLILAVVLLSGCWPTKGTQPPVAKDAAVVDAPAPSRSPEARARSAIEKQIELSNRYEDLDEREREFHDTFTGDAVVITRASVPAARLEDTTFARAKITELRAGGTADAVWFVAELDYQGTLDDGQNTPFADHERYAGLLVADHGWRIAAASLSKTMPARAQAHRLEMTGGTAPGDLTKLALVGAVLAARRGPTTIVASEAIPGWETATFTLDPNAREVTTSTWGFVQANLARQGENLAAFVVALPGAHGWTPVLIQHLAQ